MNWLKYTKVYFAVSAVMIVMGVVGLASWGLNLGVDFTGGSLLEYELRQDASTEEVSQSLSDAGVEVSSVQKTGEGKYFIRLSQVDSKDREVVLISLNEEFGGADELRFEVVGPSIGPELVKKTIYAIAISTGIILVWIAIQFKNVKFGLAGVFAMLHDSFILIGSFSLLGYFAGAEIDFLFVTALLTTLSFSVHDTIVVFDRIREISKTSGGSLEEISNRALSETMVRSLNNSFTIAFMLVALLLLGGTTVKWFAAALLVGTVLGTYSSPFVAVPLLNVLDKLRGAKQ